MNWQEGCKRRHDTLPRGIRDCCRSSNEVALNSSGCGKSPVGQRGARLSESQPAVRFPVAFHNPFKVAAPRSPSVADLTALLFCSEISSADITLSDRRFPPPWSIDELEACFVVEDDAGQKLAFVYFEDEPGRRSVAKLLTKDETRRVQAHRARCG